METITYDAFASKVRKISTLNSVSALLRWDQETYLPRLGGEGRADQLALIASMAHEELVGREMEDLLGALRDKELSAELPFETRVNIREIRRSFERERKLPADLVEEISRAQSRGFQAWAAACEASDFGIFEPCLKRNVELQRQVAELYGYREDMYDALLDLYEPGATVRQIDPMFRELKERIVPILESIAGAQRQPPSVALQGPVLPAERQAAFAQQIACDMGFDFEAGRMDTSAHPFTTSLSPRDVRLTVHYYEADPLRSILTILHEGGHGLYRQGTEWEHRGTPVGEIVSAGVDESQARYWENMVGRSRAFWTYALPRFQAAFPGTADDLETVYAHVNEVKRSLIRVGADEVTYNLHILLRYEIEKDLLNDRCQVKDLPAIWSDRMRDYLGLLPSNAVEGVLQDAHWSDSFFGYFPTYALGNLYAAQFDCAIRRDIPDLDQQISRGEFATLREWQREKIHRQGMRYLPGELVERATGEPPSGQAFVEYVEAKFLPGGRARISPVGRILGPATKGGFAQS